MITGVLVVGEAPSKIGCGSPITPDSPTGRAMAAYLEGIPARAVNLIQHPIPDGWTKEVKAIAKREVASIVGIPNVDMDTELKQGEVLILLGRQVAAAFGLNGVPFFYDDVVEPGAIIVVPHPSPRSRYWNKPENRETMKTFFATLRGRFQTELSI